MRILINLILFISKWRGRNRQPGKQSSSKFQGKDWLRKHLADARTKRKANKKLRKLLTLSNLHSNSLISKNARKTRSSTKWFAARDAKPITPGRAILFWRLNTQIKRTPSSCPMKTVRSFWTNMRMYGSVSSVSSITIFRQPTVLLLRITHAWS